ncbi:MAG: sodium:solute symporter family protein [Candidatus Cardinium sp.]|nr:sodium:solute symporter family protein [Candidatus Cardinium sp.]
MTLFNNLPLVMVAAFLLLTLVVGLYYSKKVTTLREYAIGNKDFATATLVATTLATYFGGGGLSRTVQLIHSLGLYWLTLQILHTFSIWVISRLALRMGPFMRHLSMPETIGHVYGKLPRIITALASIGATVASIATQIQITSMAITICVETDSSRNITIVLATLILIFYSSFGGIRAVTFTDVLQLITFTIIIPLLAAFMFLKINKPILEVVHCLQEQEKFHLNSLFQWNTNLVSLIAVFLSGLVNGINPTYVQRVYMSSDIIQARKVFLYAGFFSLAVKFAVAILSLFVFVDAPTLPMQEIWIHISNSIPFYFRGLLAIGLLGMTMSTADSSLNNCAVMVSHDIVECIKGRFTYSNSQRCTTISPLLLTRLTTMAIGLMAMLIAFKYNNLLKLFYITMNTYVPIISAPFLLAVFGFRSSTATALIGMFTGMVAIIVWRKWIFLETNIDGSFPCMLANGLAMLAAHYLLPQPAGTGWGLPDKTYQQWQQEKERIARRNKKNGLLFLQKKI